MAWTLTSHEKLAAAGYLFVRHVRCRRCGREILLYRKGGGRAMAIERGHFQPHRDSCRPVPGESVQGKPPEWQGELF